MFINALPDVVKTLLSQRGIAEKEQIQSFFFPELKNLPSPFEMKNMKPVVDSLFEDIKMKRHVHVWGDFDVDGITGTAMICRFLETIGGNVTWYIPNRITEGYGLNKGHIRELEKQENVAKTTILTVDCGISEKKYIDEALNAGFKVIVTDHHEIQPEKLPNCLILNGKQKGCLFKEHDLCGAGTIFFLLIGLRKKLRENGFFKTETEPNLKEYLALAALGTLSDFVRLGNVNRTIVRSGFEVINKKSTLFPGLNCLSYDVNKNGIIKGSEDITFKVSPLINAAGRLGQTEVAINLFLARNKNDAKKAFKRLKRLNAERKKICETDLEKALNILPNTMLFDKTAIVIWSDFHIGCAGITASRLVDLYKVPVILLCIRNNTNVWRGSCRSVDGINILEAIKNGEEYVENFGGHKAAAGVTIKGFLIELFEKKFCEAVKDQRKKLNAGGEVKEKPMELSLDNFNNENILRLLELMEPFGNGNAKPEFMDTVDVVHKKNIGADGNHIQFVFRGKFQNHKGIAFWGSDEFKKLPDKKQFRIIYSPITDSFSSRQSWQAQIHSFETI